MKNRRKSKGRTFAIVTLAAVGLHDFK